MKYLNKNKKINFNDCVSRDILKIIFKKIMDGESPKTFSKTIYDLSKVCVMWGEISKSLDINDIIARFSKHFIFDTQSAQGGSGMDLGSATHIGYKSVQSVCDNGSYNNYGDSLDDMEMFEKYGGVYKTFREFKKQCAEKKIKKRKYPTVISIDENHVELTSLFVQLLFTHFAGLDISCLRTLDNQGPVQPRPQFQGLQGLQMQGPLVLPPPPAQLAQLRVPIAPINIPHNAPPQAPAMQIPQPPMPQPQQQRYPGHVDYEYRDDNNDIDNGDIDDLDIKIKEYNNDEIIVDRKLYNTTDFNDKMMEIYPCSPKDTVISKKNIKNQIVKYNNAGTEFKKTHTFLMKNEIVVTNEYTVREY